MFDPTDESAGAIPDGQAPMGTDASDDASLESDSQLDGKPADSGDEDGDGTQGGLDVIKRVLDYGRKKNGIDMGGDQQVADASRPGGMGPNTQSNDNSPGQWTGQGFQRPQGMPQPTGRFDPREFMRAQGAKGYDEGGPVEDDDTTGAIPANAGDVDKASNVGNQQINDSADSIASDVGSALKSGAQAVGNAASAVGGAIPDNVVDKASNVGNQQINDSADSIASALKSGAQAAGGAIQDQVQQFPANAARIMKYLTGDAAQGHEVAAAEKAADPDGKLPESDRKIAAVNAAAQQGGDEGGWRVLQSYRQKYEALRHSAAAVADGGDLDQAAQLATKAYTHVPDGQELHFVAGPNGVTATVTEGDKVLAKVPMNAQQFRQFLTSPQAQFDQAMETSPAVTLQQTAKAMPAQVAPGQVQLGRTFQGMDRTAQAPGARGQGQSPQGQGNGDDPLEFYSRAKNTPGRAELEALAQRIFPMVSQSQQREQYVAERLASASAQASAERQSQFKQEGAMNVAQVRANTLRDNNQDTNQTRRDINDRHYDSYDARTQSIAKQKLADMISKNQNAQRGQALNLLGRAISSPGGMDPRQIAQAEKVAGVSIQQLMQQSQQSQQPGVPDMQTGQPAAPASGQPQAPTGGPKPGDVKRGFRFKGGNPSDPNSWEKV